MISSACRTTHAARSATAMAKANTTKRRPATCPPTDGGMLILRAIDRPAALVPDEYQLPKSPGRMRVRCGQPELDHMLKRREGSTPSHRFRLARHTVPDT